MGGQRARDVNAVNLRWEGKEKKEINAKRGEVLYELGKSYPF
jgi:hypothetical protein